jgi:hypothetical protein
VTANRWPLQKECNAYFGNPGTAGGKPSPAWQSANLVLVECPWVLRYEGTPVKGLRVHKNVADSLRRVLAAIWERVGQSQEEIDAIGMSTYGGGYNFRVMRGGSKLSMHSWGCALDFDPERNGLGDKTPAMDHRVVEEFEREGWEWGGHWSRPDGMHFQAAWSRANPPRLNAPPPQKLVPAAKSTALVGAGVTTGAVALPAAPSLEPVTAWQSFATTVQSLVTWATASPFLVGCVAVVITGIWAGPWMLNKYRGTS